MISNQKILLGIYTGKTCLPERQTGLCSINYGLFNITSLPGGQGLLLFFRKALFLKKNLDNGHFEV
jgi:hypothetical protein